MPTKVFKNDAGTSVMVDHQPGNGTRYLGAAHKVEHDSPDYKDRWVVSFPEWGSSYVVSEGSYLTWDYVLEKWGMRRSGLRVGKVDASEMAKMIAMMVPSVSAHLITGDDGRLLEEIAA